MLQSQQSLIRQTMFTLILATNRIYQVMSYKSIQDYRLELDSELIPTGQKLM